jgi:hypothetical protein
VVLSHLFDVHAAVGAVHDHRLAGSAVQEYGHVELRCGGLTRVVHVFSDEYLVNFLAFGRRLRRNQHHTDDLLGALAHLVQVLGELYTSAFSTATCVHLGLHDMPTGTGLLGQLLRGCYGLVGSCCDDSALNAHPVGSENFFALVFVKVHSRKIS